MIDGRLKSNKCPVCQGNTESDQSLILFKCERNKQEKLLAECSLDRLD